MKKLLLILSLILTANIIFAQTTDTVVVKIPGGGSVNLSNYFTKGQIDSINAGYYTKTQIDSIFAANQTNVVLQRDLGSRGTTTNDTLFAKAHVAVYTSSSSININADTTNEVEVTALAAGTTFNTPTGIAYYDGQNLRIIVKDNGTSQTLAFGSGFVFSTDKPNPGSTTSGKRIIFDFIYYASDNQWLCNNITNNL